MNRIKKFFYMHKKECILTLCLCAILLTIIGGSCYYYLKESKKEVFLADSIEVYSSALEEVSEKEEETKKVEEDEKQSEIIEEKIRVDIKGQVVNPGVYEATSEDRVIDIINYAGGLLDSADTSVNNLSRRIWDEMVIIIYSKEEVENFTLTKESEEEELLNSEEVKDIILNDATLKEEDIVTNQDSYKSTNTNESVTNNSNTSTNSSSPSTKKETTTVTSKISINTASKTELMKLNGIGSSKANAIISYRKENGNFQTLEDIMKVKGIGEAIFAKIKDNITL